MRIRPTRERRGLDEGQVAERLREAKATAKLTHADLRSAGVFANWWAALGRGRLPPTLSGARKIADVLGYELRFVLVRKKRR